MKLFLKIVVSVVIIFALLLGGGLFYLNSGLKAGSSVEINNVDLSTLSDGIYNGKYEEGRWTNEVNVAIKEGKITSIDIVEDVLFPKPEVTKELLNKVISAQALNVDAVSGATVSCKAYLKSIENALKK